MTAGIEVGEDGRPRCWWGAGDQLYRDYHDNEWGRPSGDDTRLFEKLCLEGFMAGLSWLTILRKRDSFRSAFANFEPSRVALFTQADEERLMGDTGIVRNRAKIAAVVNNARRCGELVRETGSLAAYVWTFAPPPRPSMIEHAELVQVKFSPEAAALSKDLRRRGWNFVGPTTVYSFMEAMGLINDHISGCFVGEEVERLRKAFVLP
jgi:DNA-3-methyladenine glycosylase I